MGDARHTPILPRDTQCMPKPRYVVHPGVALAQKIVANMRERTGKTLDEWITLVNEKGPPTEKERAAWLKARHGLGTNYAAWIAAQSVGKGDAFADPESYLNAAKGYVEALFAGPRAGLRPIYDDLMDLATRLGKDVTATPCKTMVPLRRRYVFAQIKPSTNSRIDLGLALGKTKATGRVIDTGGLAKGDRITHRIPINSRREINAEVKRWLKTAYEMDK
jgi:hypothetical protein